MSTIKRISLKSLLLDESNPRIKAVHSQSACLQAIYDDKPEQFKKLLNSIIEKGFFKGENILVVRHPDISSKYIVMEGNRRISALKLLHNDAREIKKCKASKDLHKHITKFPAKVKEETKYVYCTIYEPDELNSLYNEISTRHLSNQTSRLEWPPVRKAKRDRDINNVYSPALELIEKYLVDHPENTVEWELRYPITILEDYLKPLAEFLGYSDAKQLANVYPDEATKSTIDKLMVDILNNPGDSEVRKLENRRKNAQNYLSSIFKKPVEPLSQISKPGPHSTFDAHKSSATATNTSPKRVPPRQQRAVDPAIGAVKDIRDLSAALNIDGIKVYDSLSELHGLLRTSKYPISSGIILRTILDCCLRATLTVYGHSVSPKTTIGGMLDKIRPLIQDPQLKTTIDNISNSKMETLHNYVHSILAIPAASELRSLLATFLPLLKELINLYLARKGKNHTAK